MTENNSDSAGCGCGCLILIIVLLLGWIGQSQSLPQDIVSPSPSPSPSPTSQPLIASKWSLEVINVEYFGQQLQLSNYGDTIKTSGKWLVVSISLNNNSNHIDSVNPSNFRIIDSKNITYNHHLNLAESETYARYRGSKSVANDFVLPNQSSNYYLIFDLPLDADELKLEFIPSFLKKSQIINLDIKTISSFTEASIDKDFNLNLIKVENFGKELEWSNYRDISQAFGSWIVVSIGIENNSRYPLPLNPSNFRVIDSKRRVYNHFPNLAIAETYGRYRSAKSIANDVIDSHQSSNYYLVFDIPTDAIDLQLEFLPNILRKDKKIIQLLPIYSVQSPPKPERISVNKK